jgi:hypothetical protein
MMRRFRRHSIHLCDFLSKNSQPKAMTNSKLSRFLKVQNTVLSRLDLFRAQKYVNQTEINHMYRDRRKSWTGGSDSVQLLTLILRETVHASDVKILERKHGHHDIQSVDSSKTLLSPKMLDGVPRYSNMFSGLSSRKHSNLNLARYLFNSISLGLSQGQIRI